MSEKELTPEDIVVLLEKGKKAVIGRASGTDESFGVVYEEFSIQAKQPTLNIVLHWLANEMSDCDTLVWRVKPEVTYSSLEHQMIGLAKVYMRFAVLKDGKQKHIGPKYLPA